MARIKFGSVVTEGSGKLGGHVFQNSSGGAQLRTRPLPGQKCSPSQSFIRSLNHQLQKGWRVLTDAQRKVWNDWAVSHSVMTVRDPHKPISGHDLWMKINFSNLYAGDPVWHQPWGPDLPSYGPELIQNGTFDNSSFWTVNLPWTISGGKANYGNTGNNFIAQNLILPISVNYKLEFDVSNCATTSRIGFFNQLTLYLFEPPYNAYLLFPNGHIQLFVKILNSCTQIKIYGRVLTSSWSIDNLSLKQVL